MCSEIGKEEVALGNSGELGVVPRATPSADHVNQTADAGVAAFLAAIPGRDGWRDVAAVFHAVRCLPYVSLGDRSLEGVLARRAGSCSGKHSLLAAILNEIGVPAEVELVLGDFASPLRTARNLPGVLNEAAADGIRDVHNIVRADIGGRRTILDATWHDAVIPFGLRVNHIWAGCSDTSIAVDVGEMLGPAKDPAAEKAAIIGSWPAAEQQRRRRFLESINRWVAGLEAPVQG